MGMRQDRRRVRGLGPLAAALALACLAGPAWGADDGDVGQEIDLLRQDVGGVMQALESRARINAYYDFEYHTGNRAGMPPSFNQHHLSLFFGTEAGPWRLLSEVEYEDGVSFEVDPGSGTVDGKGALNVEFAWLEYARADALTVRAGKYLLPEYWNVHDYPNIVLSTDRPLMVRAVFPTGTSGLMVYGKLFQGGLGETYHLYYGNGQTDNAPGQDNNANKALGGHVSLHLGGLSGVFTRFDVGGGAYSEVQGTGAARDAVDVWGADTQIDTPRYELLAEYANRQSDQPAEGFYVQPSALLFGEVRGFYRYDYLDDGSNPQTRHTLGLNYRPMPNLSLKMEGNTNDFAHPGERSYNQFAASAALFF